MTYEGRSWINEGAKAPFVALNCTAGDTPELSGEAEAFVGHRMHLTGDERARGAWAEWTWDGATLQARVDALGFLQLFVYATPTRLIVSPSLLQVLAQGADETPDEAANAVFHRVGFHVGNDTGFKHIKVLPPNGHLVWRPGAGATVTGQARLPRTGIWTREQAIEAYIELPRRALQRFVATWDRGIVLPLSGGLDSRHTLLEMNRMGRLPDVAVTFHHMGMRHNAEAKAARAIAEHVRVNHKLLGKPRRRTRDSLRGALLTQLCADEIGQMMPLHDYLSMSEHAVIDGVDGDFLGVNHEEDARFVELARKGDFETIARELIEGQSEVLSHGAHRGGAGAVYSPGQDEVAVEKLATAMAEFKDAGDPYQAFWFFHRTRRELSYVTTTVLGTASMVFSPYLDPDVIDMGLSIPFELLYGDNLHKIAMERIAPDAKDVPFKTDLHDDRASRLRLSGFANRSDTWRIETMLRRDIGCQVRLRDPRLHRGLGEVYGLHETLVSGMDADRAKALLTLGDDLGTQAPKMYDVVSEMFPRTP